MFAFICSDHHEKNKPAPHAYDEVKLSNISQKQNTAQIDERKKINK